MSHSGAVAAGKAGTADAWAREGVSMRGGAVPAASAVAVSGRSGDLQAVGWDGGAGVQVLTSALRAGRGDRAGSSTCMSWGAGSSCEAQGTNIIERVRRTAAVAAASKQQ